MTRSEHDALTEKVRTVLERLSVEERELLNAVLKVESEHLHKASPNVAPELIDEVERRIR